ncbi:MAG: 3-keto-5-aminohexanoate cleavage protein [Litoreibacter sp.]|uniref:3-keto-5-aminohexanoate cleavage protein n=1 Tax=Litoreibacter sp. TaxID=1969459 RepID=UPI00329720A4
MSDTVIVTAAITGAIHTPTMSDALPITPQQIVHAAVEAVEAGAAIVHLHARNPENGAPDQSAEAFEPILSAIKDQSDVVINITTGGAPTMTVAERVRPAQQWQPELASLNMGSMNFGLFGMLGRFPELKHQWEADYLGNRDIIFRNTFEDIGFVLDTLRSAGTRFEFECYDTAHLYNLAHFRDAGAVEGPLLIQTVFGLLGGIGAHPDDVAHMKRTADRLFGDDYVWSVLGAGRNQMPIAAISAAQGGNVRVGLEDSIWLEKGVLAPSSAAQVTRVREIIEGTGRRIATPNEARKRLNLKGGNNTAF